jgi:hypothetical protein
LIAVFTNTRLTRVVFRRGLDQRHLRRRPHLAVDILAVVGDHHGGHHLFAFLPCELVVGHGREPDIGIETDLMARVTVEHRAATRL